MNFGRYVIDVQLIRYTRRECIHRTMPQYNHPESREWLQGGSQSTGACMRNHTYRCSSSFFSTARRKSTLLAFVVMDLFSRIGKLHSSLPVFMDLRNWPDCFMLSQHSDLMRSAIIDWFVDPPGNSGQCTTKRLGWAEAR